MFVVRSVRESDLNDLYKLSSNVFFINLPNDKGIIEKKIKQSIASFKSPSKDFSENLYLFVLEDLEAKQVIGCCMVHAQHGTEKEPHFYLKVSQEYKYSNTINTGFIHGTLKLGLETDGPTEIGGLVLDSSYRGHDEKLGKTLSFSRFLYMAMNLEEFKEQTHSELMPPLDKDGKSPLWEAIGRRFMNMDYIEADKLSRSNKEFILSLYPSENIYQTLLPIEARNAIGKVDPNTMPVKRMLEKIGFNYTGEVDPFDGGPHYRSFTKEISVVKTLKKLSIGDHTQFNKADAEEFLIEIPTDKDKFCAIRVVANEVDGQLIPQKEIVFDSAKVIGEFYCVKI